MTHIDHLTNVQKRPTFIRFAVLAWLCGLAALAYIHRNCLAVPAQLIEQDLNIDEDQMGQIMAVFFLGYAIFQIPSGWIGDSWGTRLVLSLLVILWSLSTGWLGLASTFLGMWLSRLAGGIAQAGIFPCSVNTISKWFPETGKAFPSGMLGSFMSVGAVLSTTITAFLLQFMSWQQAIILLSLPGIFFGIGFYLWFRDRPSEHPSVNAAELALIESELSPEKTASPESAGFPLLTMLLSLRMWLICGQQFCRAAAYAFFTTWFPSFLQQTRGVNIADSGYLTSFTLLGVVLGSASSGIIMDWIYRTTRSRRLSRKGVAVSSLAVCGALVYLAYAVEQPLLITAILALSSFCGGMAGPAGYTATIDLGGRHVATVFSTMNMAGNLGAALMPVLVVRLVHWLSWNESILLVAAMYFIAALCWAFLRVEGSIFEKPAAELEEDDDLFFRERQK